jgi:hypothetical protein
MKKSKNNRMVSLLRAKTGKANKRNKKQRKWAISQAQLVKDSVNESPDF